MRYRKFKADLLFTGNTLLDNHSVLITDEEGKVKEVVSTEIAGEDIHTFDGLLCPGFINTHCHLELSHMKGIIAPGSGLVNFLIRVMKNRTADKEYISEAMTNAADELIRTGTVAVADICNTADSINLKKGSHLTWHNFIEVMGFTPEPENRFAFSNTLLRDFQLNAARDAACSLTPHAPYSVSDPLFRLINSAAGDIISIHNQESEGENQYYRDKTGALTELYQSLNIETGFFQPSGKSSIQTYLPLINEPANILLVHNNFTSGEDIRFIRSQSAITGQKIYFATCINANLYIGSVLPPLNLMRNNGCAITLGTDSYASNYSLNLLDELKAIQHHFPAIALEELLTWATLNGAKALNLDHHYGSFEPGKKPGIIHISNVVNKKMTGESASVKLL